MSAVTWYWSSSPLLHSEPKRHTILHYWCLTRTNPVNCPSDMRPIVVSKILCQTLRRLCHRGTGGHRRPSAVIGGHRRPSAAIGGHRRPSAAIGGHRRPSAAIGGHRRPSAAIGGYRRPSAAIALLCNIHAVVESFTGETKTYETNN